MRHLIDTYIGAQAPRKTSPFAGLGLLDLIVKAGIADAIAEQMFVQRMETKWGSCTPESGYVHLDTDLAKKPPECLEYIVVHEPAHLLASMHNERFTSIMDLYLPHWQLVRRQLNRLPVGHEDWDQ